MKTIKIIALSLVIANVVPVMYTAAIEVLPQTEPEVNLSERVEKISDVIELSIDEIKDLQENLVDVKETSDFDKDSTEYKVYARLKSELADHLVWYKEKDVYRCSRCEC